MKIVSNQKTDVNTVELEVQVGPERLEEAMEAVFQREGKDINIPGFRKGKAPRKIVEKRFGKGVFVEDAVNDLYPKVYGEAIDEAGLTPVAPGDIDILDVDIDKGFTFKAVVIVKPQVTLKKYKGLTGEQVISKVTNEEVTKEIDQLRERNSRLVEVADRLAMEEDTSTIDYEGSVDGIPFEGGKGEDHQLVLGSNTFIPGFEEQIIGKAIGDTFDVTVTFPEEYHSEDLAGKEAVFVVTLHGLKTKEVPELDDEFAKDVSEFDTLDELKEDLKKNLLEVADKQAEEELENSLVDQVTEAMEAEIPEAMYENRIDQMVQDFSQRLSQQGMNMELYLQYTGMNLEDFRKTFREQAERQVKIQLAFEEIIKLEELKPSEDDFNKEYARMAEMYQMDEEQIRKMIPEDVVAQELASGLAVDLIRDSAKVNKVEKKEEVPEAKEEKPVKAAKKDAGERKVTEKDPVKAQEPKTEKTVE